MWPMFSKPGILNTVGKRLYVIVPEDQRDGNGRSEQTRQPSQGFSRGENDARTPSLKKGRKK